MKFNYDEICGSLVGNVLAEKDRNEGKIILRDFNYEDKAHRLYLNAALIVSGLYSVPIFINCDFFSYIKLILKRWKLRKQFRRIKNEEIESFTFEVVPIDVVLDYVASVSEIDRKVYEDINNEFYGGY